MVLWWGQISVPVGLTSFGRERALSGYPGVFANQLLGVRISSFALWKHFAELVVPPISMSCCPADKRPSCAATGNNQRPPQKPYQESL